ncbi:hypothetical protein G9A89_001253 [Geosiphon pyriformis]|nr:hypothetical protein G9A89_001253 [Geosiphon pyriformis]
MSVVVKAILNDVRTSISSKKKPFCTSWMVHSTLSSKLDILLNNVPINSRKHQMASSLRTGLKGYVLHRAISVDCVSGCFVAYLYGEEERCGLGSLRNLIRRAFVIMFGVPNHTLRFLSSETSWPQALDNSKDIQTYDEIEAKSFNNDDNDHDITEPQMSIPGHEERKKRKLKTGIIVKDILYDLGKKCKHHHLVHSFIIDPEDKFVQSGFTLEELTEIREMKNMQESPEIKNELLEYIATFWKASTKDIRKALYNYNLLVDFSHEHARTLNLIHLRKTYQKVGSELMCGELSILLFQIHLMWSSLNCLSEKLCRGKKAGLASAERKNWGGRTWHEINERMWLELTKDVKRHFIYLAHKLWYMIHGRKRIINKLREQHEALIPMPLYRKGKVGQICGIRTKPQQIVALRLLYCLQSPIPIQVVYKGFILPDSEITMHGDEISFSEDKIHKLNVPGFVHAGCSILIRSNLDCPKGYVCQYMKKGPYEVYANVDHFNETLDALVTIIYAKVKSHQHVLTILQTMSVVNTRATDDVKRWKIQRESKRSDGFDIPDCHPTHKKKWIATA